MIIGELGVVLCEVARIVVYPYCSVEDSRVTVKSRCALMYTGDLLIPNSWFMIVRLVREAQLRSYKLVSLICKG